MSKRFQTKWSIKKGDTVKVIAGDDKGTSAEVLQIDREKGKVLVQGVAMVSKHQKPDAKNPDGGIIKKEAFIDISNVSLVDPKSGEATRVGRREEEGKSVRYAKKSNETIK